MDYEIQLFELFHQISHKIRHMMGDVFRNAGFSMTEIFVLVSMKKRKTSRVTELAERIGIPASTLTGIIDRLESQELLTRSLDPEDRRSFIISATPTLENFIGNWMKPMESRLKQIFLSMPSDRIERMLGDLRFLLELLDKEYSADHGHPHTQN
ncbi:MAG: MarR family winged helix-turn-helix transcriptional regulator [Spirochaetia bacterium]